MKHIVTVCLHGWKKGIRNGWTKPIGLAVVCGALGIALCSSASAAQASAPVTQVEFLQMLVLATGDNLGSGATTADYVAWATRRGYSPTGGWQAGATLSKAALAQILVQVFGINPRKQGGDYVRILEREGITLPSDSVITHQGILDVLGDTTVMTRTRVAETSTMSPHGPGVGAVPPGWNQNANNPHFGTTNVFPGNSGNAPGHTRRN